MIPEDKKWSDESISVSDCKMQNSEYIDLSQVWHDVSEIPEDDLTKILYQDKTGTCWFTVMRDIVRLTGNWEHFAAVNIRCWAYISDLLPKQFRKSEQEKGGER